jgi:asparagine synthase (glutamine-hydrolysing)
MCGIAFSLDTRERGRGSDWALPLMRHRGPDSEGSIRVTRPDAVIEHCRLAIIDPENREADQPFSDPSGRWTIAYNGEVYNFRELRSDLERRGMSFRTDSDTEVVLNSYIADGEDSFAGLRGMFAFVIADRETGDVVAARDHVGVKPFYWWEGDGLVVGASEVRTVLGHPSARGELDPVGVVEYLSFGHTTGTRTIVADLRKLPPGHWLRIRDGISSLHEFWDPIQDGASAAEGDLPRQLTEHLDDAVSASLVSDVPVSLMLSGGLDSATIAVLAARHVDPADLTAYSVSFGLPTDEVEAAKRLAGDLGIRHREVPLTRDRIETGFDAWLADLDLPTANPTSFAISHIAQAVHRDSGKVLLSGDGGDELFGGYDRWMKYLRFHDAVWRHAPHAARRAVGRVAAPFASGLAGDIVRRAREDGDLFVGSRPFHDDDLAATLGPAGKATLGLNPPEDAVVALRHRFDERTGGSSDYLRWMSYVALKTHLVEDYLARLDKMGMAASVEGRVPLLDPRLVEWSFALSQRQIVDGHRQKALFRSAVSEILPSHILSRPKQGFCPPVAGWASALLADRIPASSPLFESGLVRPEAFEHLQTRGSTNAAFAQWTLGTLLFWCDRNLNAVPSPSAAAREAPAPFSPA